MDLWNVDTLRHHTALNSEDIDLKHHRRESLKTRRFRLVSIQYNP